MNENNNSYLLATKHTVICLLCCLIAHAVAHPLLGYLALGNQQLLQAFIMFLIAFSFSIGLQTLVMKITFRGKWTAILIMAFWMSLITMITMMVVEHGLIFLTSTTATHSHHLSEHSHTSSETPPFFYIFISSVMAFCLTFYYNIRIHKK